MKIIRQKDKDTELRRMLIESGTVKDTGNTRADFKLEYPRANIPPVYNLQPFVRKLQTIIERFHNETGIEVVNLRMNGTLYNRNAGNSEAQMTVRLGKLKEHGFFRLLTISFSVIYTHSGPADVRDTVHTANIIYELLKEITPSLTNLEPTINDKEIKSDDLVI